MAWYRVLRRAGIENRNRSTKKRWMFSSLVVARGGIEFSAMRLNDNDFLVFPARTWPPELPPGGLRWHSPYAPDLRTYSRSRDRGLVPKSKSTARLDCRRCTYPRCPTSPRKCLGDGRSGLCDRIHDPDAQSPVNAFGSSKNSPLFREYRRRVGSNRGPQYVIILSRKPAFTCFKPLYPPWAGPIEDGGLTRRDERKEGGDEFVSR